MALTFAEVSLSSSLLIALILALSPLLKKRYSMKWRYWAWLLVGIRLLIPFGFGAFAPLVEIPIPAPSVSQPIVSRPAQSNQNSFSANSESTGSAVTSAAPQNSGSAAGTVNSQPASNASANNSASSGSPASVPPTAPEPAGREALSWRQIVFLVWVTGAVFCLTFHLTGGIAFRCSLRRQKKAPLPETEALLQSCCRELKLRRRVALARYEAASPMAVGVFRPVILLPESVCLLPPEDLRMILLHELTHLRRRDMERKLLLLLAACIHWFNPMVWLMLRFAGQDMESTCDDAVLAICGADARERYCRLLLATAGGKHLHSGDSHCENTPDP